MESILEFLFGTVAGRIITVLLVTVFPWTIGKLLINNDDKNVEIEIARWILGIFLMFILFVIGLCCFSVIEWVINGN